MSRRNLVHGFAKRKVLGNEPGTPTGLIHNSDQLNQISNGEAMAVRMWASFTPGGCEFFI